MYMVKLEMSPKYPIQYILDVNFYSARKKKIYHVTFVGCRDQEESGYKVCHMQLVFMKEYIT